MPKDSNYTETELRKFYKEYEILNRKIDYMILMIG